MTRSLGLFIQVGEPTPLPQTVIPARDVLYHFCCDVFHLRDWIAADVGDDPSYHDNTATVRGQLNNDVIKRSVELATCRDIANGSKHLILDNPSFVDRMPSGQHAKVATQHTGISPAPAFVKVPRRVLRRYLKAAGVSPRWRQRRQSPPPADLVGFQRDSFTIDIAGTQRDAQDVAVKAVAEWDRWLAGQHPIAVHLRQTA